MNADIIGLKAVTFDLWQTLIFESDGASTMRSTTRCQNVAKTLNKFGLNVSPHQVDAAVNETINTLLKIWNQNKDVTHLDQLHYVVKFASSGKVKLKEEWIPELSDAYISSLFEIQPYLNPGAVQTLQWCRNENKYIGLICNTGITPGFVLRKFLQQQSIAQFFDTMTFSDEVAIRKPDPEIFRVTARKLGTKPQETVHVGDNLKADVWGAKNAGFRAIHLLTKEGRDRQAQDDPTSLASRSKNLGSLTAAPAAPDKTIHSLAMLPKAIAELETRKP